jgi:hypothetical protein
MYNTCMHTSCIHRAYLQILKAIFCIIIKSNQKKRLSIANLCSSTCALSLVLHPALAIVCYTLRPQVSATLVVCNIFLGVCSF